MWGVLKQTKHSVHPPPHRFPSNGTGQEVRDQLHQVLAHQREGSSVEKSTLSKLLGQMKRKSILRYSTFCLDILMSDENFCGYGYLAELVDSDSKALVKTKLVITDGKQTSMAK